VLTATLDVIIKEKIKDNTTAEKLASKAKALYEQASDESKDS
jgi:hypothetical protein